MWQACADMPTNSIRNRKVVGSNPTGGSIAFQPYGHSPDTGTHTFTHTEHLRFCWILPLFGVQAARRR